MGFFDALKGAVNAITGGGAKVTIEVRPALVMPGGQVSVKVVATSTGGEIKSGGCFVDVLGSEQVNAQNVHATPAHRPGVGGAMASAAAGQAPAGTTYNVSVSKATFEQSFQIAPAFVLAPNETKTFEGSFTLPAGVQPSFQGAYAKHAWSVRGRIEAWGNDPDSGYQPMRVGLTT
jgi:hypothetical protein